MGDALTPYFMGKTVGSRVLKPERRMTCWWREMLARFAETRFEGWVEASHALLCVGFEEQKGFEKKVREIVREVRHNWHTEHNDTIILMVGSKAYRTAIVVSAIKNKSWEEMRRLVHGRMGHATDKFGAQRVLGIAVSATTKMRPYLGAYYWCPEINELGENVGAAQMVNE